MAANELSRRRYFAAPIVDGENHIVGIIKAEQLIQGIQEEAALAARESGDSFPGCRRRGDV